MFCKCYLAENSRIESLLLRRRNVAGVVELRNECRQAQGGERAHGRAVAADGEHAARQPVRRPRRGPTAGDDVLLRATRLTVSRRGSGATRRVSLKKPSSQVAWTDEKSVAFVQNAPVI